MASLDRGMMNDRLDAIGRGEFDPATGEFAQGFGPAARADAAVDAAGPADPAGFGGRGGPGGAGRTGRRRGGPGGPGGFVLGGRGGRQNAYTFTEQLHVRRLGARQRAVPAASRLAASRSKPYTRQTLGGTLGGPVKIRHVYNGTRRTNFMLTYTGNRGANLFDQYATVPTAAMRAGDFSATGVTLIDPATGQPFAGNQIPAGADQPDGARAAALHSAAEPDGTSRNFHYVTTTELGNDNVNLRVTHNFTPTAAGRGGRGGPGGGGGGGGFGGAGRPRRPRRGSRAPAST